MGGIADDSVRPIYLYGAGLFFYPGYDAAHSEIGGERIKEKNETHIERPHGLEGLKQAGHTDTIREDDILTRCRICDRGLENLSAARVTFRQVHFKNVLFTGSALPAADMEDVIFENCDLSNLNLTGAVIYRAEFRSCKLMGVNLTEASLKNILFAGCAMKYANLRFAKLEKLKFEECMLAAADFEAAHLTKTEFRTCDLRQAQLSGVPLAGIDLSSCDIDGLGARPEDLRGVILFPEQTVTAAKIVGVIIKND